MRTKARNVKEYQSSLQNYALGLSADENFMSRIGLSERVLDVVLRLPHGSREREFVKYALEMDRNSHSFQQAA